MKPSATTEANRRILVIDDNRAIHDDTRKILCGGGPLDLESDEELLFNEKPAEESAHFEIDSAYQGAEGLAMVEQSLADSRPYAMAFVDIRMPPGWDGVETIEKIWKVDPDLQVVICTAYSDYSWSDIQRRLGNSNNLLILKKPFDNIEVVQLAHALTNKWLVSRQAAIRMADLDSLVARRTEQLQKAEEAFRGIFAASPIGIALADTTGHFLDANRSYTEMFGVEREQILGKDAVELGWRSREAMQDLGRGLASFGRVDAREFEFPTPKAGRRYGLLWLREITIQHMPYMLAFCLDITDRKQMEEDLEQARAGAEAAARAKSSFIANMSHEIRTPLNGVLSLSALLEDENLPEDTLFMLRLIRASGEMLAKILDDVLDFSKIECGKLEIERAAFSLRDAVVWAVELFRAKAGEKHLELKLTMASDIPDRLDGDATRIRQVLANLISNAIKFTEEGSVEVEAKLSPDDAPAGSYRIRISVRDTGIGIPPEKIGRLFQPFSQVDASTNRRFGGSGLGLVISRRLVEMMGGSISLQSRPGEGSTFTFDFVAAITTNEGEQERVDTADLGKMRVLVAEDNPVNQVVIQRVLERIGCTADLVGDGEEAIRQVQAAEYDAILMDIQMPGMDGLEAARRIRSLAGDCARIPIVALTASATVEDRRKCLAAGMNDYLSKPIAIEALRKVLKRWKPLGPGSAAPAPNGYKGQSN